MDNRRILKERGPVGQKKENGDGDQEEKGDGEHEEMERWGTEG